MSYRKHAKLACRLKENVVLVKAANTVFLKFGLTNSNTANSLSSSIFF